MKYISIVFLFIISLGGCQSTDNKSTKNSDIAMVTLSFDVNTDGKPENITVIKSDHVKFNRQAKRDIAQWTYKRKIVDGVPVIQKGLTAELKFDLN